MFELTDEMLLDLLYNRKLPEVYRSVDVPKLYLQRYLNALIDGGYGVTSLEARDIIKLVDPDNCPEEFLPYLVESFGITYFEDILPKYQRRIVANIGELIRRRGTYSGVTFLVRVLSGMNCTLEYFRGTYQGEEGRFLIVTMKAETTEQISEMDMSSYVVSQYVTEFVPFYITVKTVAVVALQNIDFGIQRYLFGSPGGIYNFRDGWDYLGEKRPVFEMPKPQWGTAVHGSYDLRDNGFYHD